MESTKPHSGNIVNMRNGRVFARQGGRALLLAAFVLIVSPSHLRAQITATASPTVLGFSPAVVGISAASAQQLTASFDVSGYTGTFTPTAALHYGYDYTAGAVDCTGGASPETCTVTVTFQPTLPGARKDALFLMNGSAILSTVLLGGVGQAPLALVQPGVVTSPLSGTSYTIYNSTVDENGTVYFLATEQPAVYSLTQEGVLTELVDTTNLTTLTSPVGIAIDGAGTLYIVENTYNHQVITYNPNVGVGSITVNPPSPYTPCSNSGGGTLEYLNSVAFDEAGNLFTLEILCGQIFELTPSGTYVTTPISPAMTQPSQLAVDAYSDVFIGGYDINELTSGGTQTQINTVGATEGLGVDAAETVYATRYTGYGGVVELPASSYGTALASLDSSAPPLGLGLGSDGTLYVGNYTELDKVDRSQGAIAFGEQYIGTTSTAMDVGIYNGGNEPLTISNIALPGSVFAEQATETNSCSDGTEVAPGAQCQVAVTMTAPHAGTFSGTLTFTSNSLNNTSAVNNVALSGYVYGPYVTSSPTSLSFGSQNVGTTSATQTVTLTNNGDLYSAGLGTPSAVTGFSITANTCTIFIAVGASCQISVAFSPTSATGYSGTFTIPVSSSGGGGPWPSGSFTVSGTGVEPLVSLSPSSLTFPPQIVGTTGSTQTVTLSNTGNEALTLTGMRASGGFSSTSKCGTTVMPGGNCAISVTFKPRAPGTYTGTLSIWDNGPGSPQTVALSGTGLVFTVGPHPPVLSPPPTVPEPVQTVSPGGSGLPIAVGPRQPMVSPSTLVNPHPRSTTTSIAPVARLSSSTLVSSAQVVGISAASAQQLTASFDVSGYTGTFTPTAALHYGYDYTAGAVDCTGGASPETCTVTVTFQPTLPGARKDALFLMNGSAILSTVLLGGVGQAPLALVQPGEDTYRGRK